MESNIDHKHLEVRKSQSRLSFTTPKDGIVSHWGFANYLLDGHHKIEAAALEGLPVKLISFISKDASFRVVDKLTEFYKKLK
ncbi:MAG: hypothetical protein ACK5KL_02005 [Dysgonomonas sp.]